MVPIVVITENPKLWKCPRERQMLIKPTTILATVVVVEAVFKQQDGSSHASSSCWYFLYITCCCLFVLKDVFPRDNSTRVNRENKVQNHLTLQQSDHKLVFCSSVLAKSILYAFEACFGHQISRRKLHINFMSKKNSSNGVRSGSWILSRSLPWCTDQWGCSVEGREYITHPNMIALKKLLVAQESVHQQSTPLLVVEWGEGGDGEQEDGTSLVLEVNNITNNLATASASFEFNTFNPEYGNCDSTKNETSTFHRASMLGGGHFDRYPRSKT